MSNHKQRLNTDAKPPALTGPEVAHFSMSEVARFSMSLDMTRVWFLCKIRSHDNGCATKIGKRGYRHSTMSNSKQFLYAALLLLYQQPQ